MPRFLTRLLPALLVLLVAACATGPRITSEIDPSAAFGSYRSFGFYSPLAVESRGYQTMATGQMRAAVRREMEARGYVYDESSPDLLVNINAYLNERQDVVSMPEVRHAWYYSYRNNAYVPVPYWTERTSVTRYTEGTMNVDLVDARTRRLVWEGVAVGRMSRVPAAERNARIHQTIAEIFARYPHRAAGR